MIRVLMLCSLSVPFELQQEIDPALKAAVDRFFTRR